MPEDKKRPCIVILKTSRFGRDEYRTGVVHNVDTLRVQECDEKTLNELFGHIGRWFCRMNPEEASRVALGYMDDLGSADDHTDAETLAAQTLAWLLDRHGVLDVFMNAANAHREAERLRAMYLADPVRIEIDMTKGVVQVGTGFVLA